MKKGWEIKKLGEVCEINCGSTPLRGNKLFWENGTFPWFTIEDIRDQGRIINYTKQKVTNLALTKLKLFPENTVLLCCTASVGEYALTKIQITSNQQFNGLTVSNTKQLYPNFLFHFCSTLKEKLLNLSGKTTIDFVSQSKIKGIEIPIPTLSEQQRIVQILDKAFENIDTLKANAERNLQNVKELFQSALTEELRPKKGWIVKKLGECCEFSQGIQRDVKLQSEIKKENQVRFLRIIDFTQGDELPRFIDNPGGKYILNENDISIVRYGASTGFVCRGLQGALANNLFRVIPKSINEVTNDFLFIYLTSPVFQNVVKESMNGAAMPAISFGLIKDIPVPIIPLKVQKTIVEHLDSLSVHCKGLEANYQKTIVQCEEMKKAVLGKAFRGEL